VIPAQSMQMKSAMAFDLILEDSMNLALFLLLIEIITCFLEELFVVIFSLGLGLPMLLMIL